MDNGKCRFRTAYDDVRFRVTLDCGKESMTKQSFKDECDINLIMAQYVKTGVLPVGDPRVPQFMDCDEFDYHEAMLTVANAKALFNDLPSSVRDRFHNNPAELLQFVGQEANRAEAERLGFVKPSVSAPPPVRVEVVAPGNAPGAFSPSPSGGPRSGPPEGEGWGGGAPLPAAKSAGS